MQISYEQLHKINGRGTPHQMMKYKHSLLLHKLYNSTRHNEDWMDMNLNQSFSTRCTKFKIFDVSNVRVGKNILSNRLALINNEIEYDWLNKSLNSYKVLCKKQFLTQEEDLQPIVVRKILMRHLLFLYCKIFYIEIEIKIKKKIIIREMFRIIKMY